MRYVLILSCLLANIAMPAHATVIDFEAQAAGTGGLLTGVPDSPLTVGNVTFTGGELRNAEVGLAADQTGVYASQGLFGSGETNPLTITFSVPVSAFSLFVVNGDDARSYTVADNAGDSLSKTLPSAGALGAAVFSLSGTGITAVTIASANAAAWDFAIDNVSSTAQAGPATVPEPSPAVLVLMGAAMMAFRIPRLFQR